MLMYATKGLKRKGIEFVLSGDYELICINNENITPGTVVTFSELGNLDYKVEGGIYYGAVISSHSVKDPDTCMISADGVILGILGKADKLGIELSELDVV